MKHWIIIGLLFWVSLPAFAQEIRVKSYKQLNNDLTARTMERLDGNNDPCSVIKISSAGKGFTFDGDVIGAPIIRTGETMIYVPEGTRRITIRHPKYGVLRYEFPERIQKQAVYESKTKTIN